MSTESIKQALKRAFQLGQNYWSWADSEYSSHWKKADAAKAEFDKLVEDTLRTTPPVAQPAPVQDDLDEQVIRERDEAEAIADALAEKIAAITGCEIGEHTSANSPWHSALDAADEFLASRPPAAQPAPVQEPEVRFKCTVIDEQHPNGVPLEQWGNAAQRQWVGLGQDDIDKLKHMIDWTATWSYGKFACEIERILKEKNA